MAKAKKDKPKKDKYILFWVYGDGDDTPYVIINPPRNLGTLLKQWNKLDRLMTDDKPGAEEWDYVNKWLKSKGVNIVEAGKQVRLDDYQ